MVWISILLLGLFLLAVLAGLLGWVKVKKGERSFFQELAFWSPSIFIILGIIAYFFGGVRMWLLLILAFLGMCYFFYRFGGERPQPTPPVGKDAVEVVLLRIAITVKRVIEGFKQYCKLAE